MCEKKNLRRPVSQGLTIKILPEFWSRIVRRRSTDLRFFGLHLIGMIFLPFVSPQLTGTKSSFIEERHKSHFFSSKTRLIPIIGQEKHDNSKTIIAMTANMSVHTEHLKEVAPPLLLLPDGELHAHHIQRPLLGNPDLANICRPYAQTEWTQPQARLRGQTK